MKFDETKYEAALCLSHIRHPGRFAVEVNGKIGRAIRIACPLDAHSHVLQASALLTGLAALKRQGIANGRILVSSDVRTFVDAIRNNRRDRLSLPMPMRERLRQELQESAITFEYNVQPASHIALENWLYRSPLKILDDLQGLLEQQAA
jgi:hypothetical protein